MNMRAISLLLFQAFLEFDGSTLLEGLEHFCQLLAFTLLVTVKHQFWNITSDAVNLYELMTSDHEFAFK